MSKELRKHIEEIISLEDSEFDYISSLFTEKKLKRHQYLIQVDEPVTHTYWVKKGLLKASFIDERGKEHIIQFAMENWWISDYLAYFTQTNSILTVNCLEDTELLCLSFENREKICREMHKMEYFFRKKANSGFIALQKRMLSFMADSPQKRYALLLKQYPKLIQRVPKSILALYLGVSRETLSRFNGL